MKTTQALSPPQQVQKLNLQAVDLAGRLLFSEAITLLKEAITLAPNYPNSYQNLGAIYQMQGDWTKAQYTLSMALQISPKSAKVHFNLANIYRKSGDLDKAIMHLNQVMALDPKHHSAAHILAATIGKTTNAPPQEYIVNLFDQFSVNFDEILQGSLCYQTPVTLKTLMLETLGANPMFERAVDLGCGTGLVAKEIHSFTKILHGIDLSPKMLAKASQINLYHQLFTGDIVDSLRRMNTNADSKYDLFIAADTFVYIGNLEPVFQSIQSQALPGALVLFSTETSNTESYELCSTGRYAHNSDYIKKLGEAYSMKTLGLLKNQPIRKDEASWILGDIFLMKMSV